MLLWHIDGREVKNLRDRDVVEADDRDILRNAEALLAEGLDGAGCDQVIVREIAAREGFISGKELLHVRVGAAHRRRELMDDRLRGRHAMEAHGLVEAVLAFIEVIDRVA